MHRIYIALGSNLEKPSKQIHSAIRSIDRIHGISVTQISSLYKTKPIGKLDQPDFINAVIELEEISLQKNYILNYKILKLKLGELA